MVVIIDMSSNMSRIFKKLNLAVCNMYYSANTYTKYYTIQKYWAHFCKVPVIMKLSLLFFKAFYMKELEHICCMSLGVACLD